HSTSYGCRLRRSSFGLLELRKIPDERPSNSNRNLSTVGGACCRSISVQHECCAIRTFGSPGSHLPVLCGAQHALQHSVHQAPIPGGRLSRLFSLWLGYALQRIFTLFFEAKFLHWNRVLDASNLGVALRSERILQQKILNDSYSDAMRCALSVSSRRESQQ